MACKGKGGKGAKKKAKRRKNSVGGKRFAGRRNNPKVLRVVRVHDRCRRPLGTATLTSRSPASTRGGPDCSEFGLKIHDELPWLGATPDGVTDDGKILEVKCPYSRPVLPNVRCKEHYPQLQVLMQVYNLDSCDFVQFKPAGVGMGHAGVMNEDRPLYLMETVARDDHWWRNQPRLSHFRGSSRPR